MNRIELLSDRMISQIAAGEVVERPLSVVKELVENSVDAGASAVTVEIRDGGLSLIRVSDNGRGIPPDQARTAFLQHATSKISDFDDLVNVETLGFRGEALPSIASVSRTEMVTKAAGELAGKRIEIDGGVLAADEEIGCAEGTTVIVRNLFYNTPARLKFLKKPAHEAAAVTELMHRLAVGRPDIAFKYISNSEALLQTNGGGDLKTAVYYVLGKEISGKLLAVDSGEGARRVRGFAGKPEIARANRSYQFFYINGRYVRSELIRAAAEEAFRSMLMTGKFPVAVLSLEIPPAEVDVNVHPSKLEVRFRDEEGIFALVRGAVEDSLREFDLIPEAGAGARGGGNRGKAVLFREAAGTTVYEAEEAERGGGTLRFAQEYGRTATPDAGARKTVYAGGNAGNGATATTNTDKNAGDGAKTAANLYENTGAHEGFQADDDAKTGKNPGPREVTRGAVTDGGARADGARADRKRCDNAGLSAKPDKAADAGGEPVRRGSRFFDDYRIVGQVFATYWIIEQGDSLFFVDQHAAHERILYEKLLKRLEENSAISQRLLVPITVELGPVERQIFLDNMRIFEDFGFDFEKTGKSVVISAMPFMMKSPCDSGFFLEMLDKIGRITNAGDVVALKRGIVAAAACKAAVKANDSLGAAEAEAIVKGLLGLDDPFTCPHGRPTIIGISRREWEKKFKRII